MKKAAVTLFILGAISIFIFFCWMFFAFIYFFQEPREYESMGLLLEVSRYPIFWVLIGSLIAYSLSFYGLAHAGDRVKNPKWLMKALHLRGWKVIFAILAIMPLLVIKLARVIWQTNIFMSARSFSREVMEEFS